MSRRSKSAVGNLIDQVDKRNTKTFKVEPIGFKTKKQKTYYEAILTNTIVVSTGVPGSGKSFIAVYAACCELASGNIDKIIITKPAVEIGKTQGYLPGGMEEKMAPYVRSVEECFFNIIGEQAYHKLAQTGKVEILPLNYMRGLTIENTIVIADEMQNADYGQVKALLTRIGENSKFVLNGDLEQSDLSGRSGLPSAIKVLEEIDNVAFVDFEVDDVVRSGILKEIILGYYRLEKNE